MLLRYKYEGIGPVTLEIQPSRFFPLNIGTHFPFSARGRSGVSDLLTDARLIAERNTINANGHLYLQIVSCIYVLISYIQKY